MHCDVQFKATNLMLWMPMPFCRWLGEHFAELQREMVFYKGKHANEPHTTRQHPLHLQIVYVPLCPLSMNLHALRNSPICFFNTLIPASGLASFNVHPRPYVAMPMMIFSRGMPPSAQIRAAPSTFHIFHFSSSPLRPINGALCPVTLSQPPWKSYDMRKI